MPESIETNPQPTTSEPGPVDWSTPDTDEIRLPPPKPNPEDQPNPDNAVVEGGDEEEAQPQAAQDEDDPIGEDPEEAAGEDDGPEFWSKEDKAFWKSVPPELKPILQKYERQRIEFANKKAEEAAGERKKAMEEAAKASGANEQYAKWWEANGESFVKTFVDRWSGVNWNELAEKDPAEWARLSQLRANEHAMLTQANTQAQAARVEAESRAKAAHQEARSAEHAKLAKEFPKEFGTPELAKRTYDTLGAYAAKLGFPPERINNIYEADVVKVLRKAYKYDQLQAKAKGITNPKPPAQSASTTPTRVVPGARNTSANPVNDATRQAVERLRSGERLSSEEAGWAFR